MPFTPFHFGAGLAVKSLGRNHFSFLLFIAAQIIIDLESGYFLLTNEWPVHRFLHTYLGATLIFPAIVLLGKPVCEIILKYWHTTTDQQSSITWLAAILGAGIGVYSHVLLDSIMHSDMQPFAPFFEANSMLHLITLNQLHLFCIYSGLIGILILFLTYLVKRGNKAK